MSIVKFRRSRRADNFKLSIIVATYNEQKTIPELIAYIEQVQYPIDYEIIIVDDASVKKTQEQDGWSAKNNDVSPRAKIFKNEINRGKGFSIREGIKKAQGNILVVQDADDEYNPHDIPELLRPILEGKSEVVYGSRFLNCFWPQGMTLPCWLANKSLTKLTNVLFGLHLTDMETCYKVFRREVIQDLPLKANRFTFEPEVTALLAKKGISIQELPISYHARTKKEGKKIRPKDFFFALGFLVWEKFLVK